MQQVDNIDVSAIRLRILHCLSIYPRISPSMLQVGIGPSLPPSIWKPLLDTLIGEGKVVREIVSKQTPQGRLRTYEVLFAAN